MAVMRWDPWGELASLQRDMNQILGRVPGAGRGASMVPPMAAYRTDDGLVIRIELPGMKAEEVEVAFQDGMLSISGERTAPHEVSAEEWLRRERPVGRFERAISLPDETDADRIEARFEDGVLELRVPHPPERKPRKIQVSAGSEGSPVELGRSEPAMAS